MPPLQKKSVSKIKWEFPASSLVLIIRGRSMKKETTKKSGGSHYKSMVQGKEGGMFGTGE